MKIITILFLFAILEIISTIQTYKTQKHLLRNQCQIQRRKVKAKGWRHCRSGKEYIYQNFCPKFHKSCDCKTSEIVSVCLYKIFRNGTVRLEIKTEPWRCICD